MSKNKKNSWWGNSGSSSKDKSEGYTSSFFDWNKWTGKGSWKPTPKKQIVKPYMGWYEANKVVKGIHEDTEFTNRLADNTLSKILTGKPTADNSIRSKAGKLYREAIPDHLIEDIYSIYYNKSSNLEFSELKDSNEVKFKILEKVNNSLLKIVSNNNAIASFMYTKEISHFLMEELLQQLSEEELDQLKNSMRDCNEGEGKSKDNEEGDSEDTDADGEGDSKDGNGKSGKGKGKSSKGSKSKGNGTQGEGSDDSEGEDQDSNEDESGDNSSEQDSSTENDSYNEESGEFDSDESNNSTDNHTGSPQSQSSSSKDSSKGASKSGHRKNPLTGHNAKEDTSGVKEWKEKNAKSEKKKSKEEILAEKIESIFSKSDVQKRFDEAINKADQLMMDLEKAGINLKEDGLGQIAEIANLKEVRNDIHALTMNKRAIAEAIKQILDNSKNYFSKKYKLKEIDLLEADEIEEIYGIEYIHPIFRSTMLDRLSTEERKYQGKIDLFIDVSGSMGSNSGIPGVSNLLFAKSIALAMLSMDLLNNLYTFDTSITKIPVNELAILMIGFGGGTSIETVVKHVVNVSKNNAICLTDGEDSVQTYDERMFFMGTIGVMFSYFSHPHQGNKDANGRTAGQRYLMNNQCINFDGQKSTVITKTLLQSQGRWYE